MIVTGLKHVRAKLTALVDLAREGDEAIFIEKGNCRQLNIGYKLVRMTDAELSEAVKKHPELCIPKPGLPQPVIVK